MAENFFLNTMVSTAQGLLKVISSLNGMQWSYIFTVCISLVYIDYIVLDIIIGEDVVV